MIENTYRNNQVEKKSDHDKNVDLVAEITKMPRPHKIVDMPRNKPDGTPFCQIGLVLLSSSETLQVKVYAETTTRKLLKEGLPQKGEQSIGFEECYNELAAIGILWHACRKVDELEKKFFPSPEAIQKALTIDEISILYNHYLTVQASCGTIVSSMNQEEMDDLIKRIQDGATDSNFLLNLYSSAALKMLIGYMASRLSISQTPKSSSGLLPENGEKIKKSKKKESPLVESPQK